MSEGSGRRSEATFRVTGWDQEAYAAEAAPPYLARAVVRKEFEGALSGESEGRLLLCQVDESDPGAGAGYVASEVVRGSLEGREGTFVIQHLGVMGAGTEPSTFGHVVPGTGTGELEGLAGDVQISVDEDGTHRIALEWRLA